MRAVTVRPGKAESLAVSEVPDPRPGPGELAVDGLALGICGTDREILAGDYGWAPPGRDHLVLGHESLGRIREAPEDSGFRRGDLVAGVVRRPDPVPCGACAHGQFDMCRNGRYTERGIKEADGYGSTSWTVEADYAVRLDPGLERNGVLMEPASVVAKAWDQIERVGRRAWFEPETVLVTGAGPIGLLAALLGRQRGLDVHVLDRVTGGPKPRLVADLGATYHHGGLDELGRELRPDIVVEATGAPPVVLGAMTVTGPYGLVCLTGVSSPGRRLPVDAGGLNREVVLENDALIGSVNANLGHFRLAADALAKADPEWLSRLISRRVPLERAEEAFQPRDDDVKVVLDLTAV
ncbi:glucose 1-dehydrogenase [Amycolatopsis endophytica]|uniref:Threonine dehydrogenase-like Zn-dependent dehydrogenase n=1 Tax=Amycolatopsis endophytica TaxID=860233 RepID=A0A853B9M9_9PSEU|nr:glucose 1-dehydrogenase [Amycolatopsis endophytica]NYI91505.1 threonine dehydrogenase-like Zn-dependent dehydrogenase [Amycolatopsis endophytica]